MRIRRRAVPLALLALLAVSCAAARNYPDPAGPRFAGRYAAPALPAIEAIKVVSFNVKFARHVARAAEVLRETPALRGADVITLQEMDEAGTDSIARALSLNYVYYPSAVYPPGRKNFGNAILSRWPVTDDAKIVLPGHHRLRKLERIAVAATVQVGGMPVRVYSVHLEAPGAIGGAGRRAQARTVLEHAAAEPLPVVVAGDFNNRAIVADVFRRGGFVWPTRRIGHTISLFSWDHVFARGLRLRDCASAGVVRNKRGASDHHPIWAVLVPDTGAAANGCE